MSPLELTLSQRRGNWAQFRVSDFTLGSGTVWIQRARLGYRVMPPKIDGPTEPLIRTMVLGLNTFLSRRNRHTLAFSGFDVIGSDIWEQELRNAGWTELSRANRFVSRSQTQLVCAKMSETVRWHDFPGAVPQAGEVLEAAWEMSADPLTVIRRGKTNKYLRDLALSHPRMVVGVVQRKGQPAGMIILAAESHQAWILDVAVKPDFRRTGLASGLVHAGLCHAFQQGAREVSALIDQANLPSLRLHEHLGFTCEDGPYRTFLLRETH